MTACRHRTAAATVGLHHYEGLDFHADAIVDRIVHNTIWIDTGNHNMREHTATK